MSLEAMSGVSSYHLLNRSSRSVLTCRDYIIYTLSVTQCGEYNIKKYISDNLGYRLEIESSMKCGGGGGGGSLHAHHIISAFYINPPGPRLITPTYKTPYMLG